MHQPTQGTDSPKRHTRLLIVDDNPAVVQGLAIRLVHRGYECITALDGHEAMRLMADPGIDALVTDLDMPYLDGFALIDLAASFKPCRCVVITGSADSAMRCYQDYPGLPVMMKPFKTEHIITALESIAPFGPRSMPDVA